MKKKQSLFQWKRNYKEITVYEPSEIEVTFDSLIGLNAAKEDLHDVIQYIKDPEIFEKLNVRPHMHYVIQGEDGLGKNSLAFALAHEAEIPIVVVDCKNFVDTRKTAFNLLENAFKVADGYENSVLLFKEFHRFFQINEEFKYAFIRTLLELMKEYTNVIVITTLSVDLNIIGGEYLFDEDAFSKTIDLIPPDLKTREKMYETFCKNIMLDDDVSLARIAIDSYGMSAKDIKRIIRNATLLAIRANSPTVKHEHFDEVISLELLGQKRKKMTEKERLATAYHEAGHVVAGYFSNPEYKLSKVEIVHRTGSLGVTMPENDEDKLSNFKKDLEYEIISLYGGMVAERIIFGENSSGVSADLSMATSTAKFMVAAYGMSDDFGPFSVYEALFGSTDVLIFKTPSDTLFDKVNEHASKIINTLYQKCYNIVLTHKKELEALTKALLEKEVVYGSEIEQIFKDCNAPKED